MTKRRQRSDRKTSKTAVPADPRELGALLEDAHGRYHAGDLTGALAAASKLYKFAPQDTDVLSFLGQVLVAKHAYPRAIKCLRQVVHAHAENVNAWIQLGRAYEGNGDADGAIGAYRRVVELLPGNAQVWINFGATLFNYDRHEQAIEAYQRALAIEPSSADAHSNIGIAWSNLDRLPEALRELKAAAELRPNDPVIRSNLGSVLVKLNRTADAVEEFLLALLVTPNSWQIHRNLAQAYLELGQFEASLRHFSRVRELAPEHPDALADLTFVVRLSQDTETGIRTLEHALQGARSGQDVGVVHFALAELYDRLNNADTAFNHARIGNRLRSKHVHYDPKGVESGAALQIAAYPTARLQVIDSPPAPVAHRPIFIVGMPRSGTSLLEQLLARHKSIFAGGEIGYLGEHATAAAEALVESAHETVPNRDNVRRTLMEIRDGYLAMLGSIAGDSPWVTDKMPFNFQNIGLIRILFPHSPIVHCTRDPLDTCLSCFFQNFASPNAIAFSSSLDALAHYYRQYERMMTYWHGLHGQTIQTVAYETVTSDPTLTVRQLLDYWGIARDETETGDIKAPTRTASLLQVRSGVNTRSVGRWKRYAAHLQPLIRALSHG